MSDDAAVFRQSAIASQTNGRLGHGACDSRICSTAGAAQELQAVSGALIVPSLTTSRACIVDASSLVGVSYR
jgi:hypothetical protein